MKNKILLTSLLSIGFFSALAAGATYAYFIAENNNDLGLGTSTVKVSSNIFNVKYYSLDEEQYGDKFANDGELIQISDGNFELKSISPGDTITFDLSIQNESDINIAYAILVNADGDLNEILDYDIKEMNNWTYFDEKSVVLSCYISLPYEMSNDYQGKSLDISISIEAVQANALRDVTFYDTDGEVLYECKAPLGGKAIYHGETPTKEALSTDDFVYNFVGWDKNVDCVTGNIETFPVFEEVYPETNYYTVVFKDYDGSILYEDTVYEGKDAYYLGETLDTKLIDGVYYVYDGWDIDFTNVTENLVVNAVCDAHQLFTFIDNGDDTYTVKIDYETPVDEIQIPSIYNGKTVNRVTTFTNEYEKNAYFNGTIYVPASIATCTNYSICGDIVVFEAEEAPVAEGDDYPWWGYARYGALYNLTKETMILVDGVLYNLEDDGTLTASRYIGKSADGDDWNFVINIPGYLEFKGETYHVKTFGDGSKFTFGHSESNAEFVFGEGIEVIADYAFSSGESDDDYRRRDIVGNLPSTLTYIGTYGLAGANFYVDLVLPNSLEYLGDYALRGVDLVSPNLTDAIYLPENDMDYFGQEAISGGTRYIYVPSEIKTLPHINSTMIYLLEVTEEEYTSGGYDYNIGEEVWNGSQYVVFDTLKYYYGIDKSDLYIKDYIVYILNDNNTATAVTILDTNSSNNNYDDYSTIIVPDEIIVDNSTYVVTSIGSNFAYRDGYSHYSYYLNSVHLPETINSIGNYAFYNLQKLNDFNLPNNVTSIGKYAFSGISSTKTLFLTSNIHTIDEGAFNGYKGALYVSDSMENIQANCSWYESLYSHSTIQFDMYENESYVFDENGFMILLDSSDNTATIVGVDKTSYDSKLYVPSSVEVNSVVYTIDTIANYGLNKVPNSTIIYLPDTINYVYYSSFARNNNILVFEGSSKPTQLDFDSEYSDYRWYNNMTILYNNQETVVVDPFVFSVLEDGNLKLIKFICDAEYGESVDVTIPAKVIYDNKEYNVTTIGPRALCYSGEYYYYDNIISNLILEEGITTIEEYGLGYISIGTIFSIPSTLLYVDEYAFRGSSNASIMLVNMNEFPSTWEEGWIYRYYYYSSEEGYTDYEYFYNDNAVFLGEGNTIIERISYEDKGYEMYYRITNGEAYILHTTRLDYQLMRQNGRFIVPETVTFDGISYPVVGLDSGSIDVFKEVYIKRNILYIADNVVTIYYGDGYKDSHEGYYTPFTQIYYELDGLPIGWWDKLAYVVNFNWDPSVPLPEFNGNGGPY